MSFRRIVPHFLIASNSQGKIRTLQKYGTAVNPLSLLSSIM